MAVDPITSLTVPVLVLLATGGLMLRVARREPACRTLRWGSAAILCLGFGFAMLMLAPTDIEAPLRVFGTALLMLAQGLLWGAARVVNRRAPPFEIVVAGALGWLVLASAFDPSQAWRIAITSAIVIAYSAATASEHRAGDHAAVPARRWAFRIFAGHGTFYLLRMLLGPTLGLFSGSQGGLIGLEAVLMAVPFGVLSVLLSRERPAGSAPRGAIEDALTGIGNRSALATSGSALIAATRADGRPTALLLMDLDRFQSVNDLHGHPAGDRLLVAFARLAHDYLPPASLVCRVDGEAFAALVPGADAVRARTVADEIRALFAHLTLDGPRGPVRTTVSIGLAVADPGRDEVPPDDGGGLEALMARAEGCLSAAKRSGRDRVVAEGDPLMSGRAA